MRSRAGELVEPPGELLHLDDASGVGGAVGEIGNMAESDHRGLTIFAELVVKRAGNLAVEEAADGDHVRES